MAKGGNKPTTTVTQSAPSAAMQPYITDVLTKAQGLAGAEYTPYTENRIAEFTPEQIAVQERAAGLTVPTQFAQASNLASQAGLGALGAAKYDAGTFNANNVGIGPLNTFQMSAPRAVTAGTYNAPSMTAATGEYNPTLENYSMAGPDTFTSEFAQRYMSPYIQNVLDVQKERALRDAKMAQLTQNLGAARQGTYGGARQLLATTEREAALGRQMADIQATGMQSAYQQAMQQFNAEQALTQQQRQANLNAQLQTQALRTNTGLQMAMANLSNEQQARVQNQAAILQTQGLNAEQALRAAIANQQSELTVGQQNLAAQLGVQQLQTQSGLQAAIANQQAQLEAQRAAEQSRQFGAQQALNAYAQMGQAGQTLSNIGASEGQLGLAQLNAQNTIAAQQQELEQKKLDQQYADFLEERDWEAKKLQDYANLVGAMPAGTSSVSSQYNTPTSPLAGVAGAGLTALSYAKMMNSPA